MLEIDDYIISTLENDVSLYSLLGEPTDDSRIYGWNPSFEITFTDIYQSAIFYKKNQYASPSERIFPSQRGNIYYFFQIVSLDSSLAEQIRERIDQILCSNDLTTFYTDNFKILFVKNNGTSEDEVKGTASKPLYVKNISIMLGQVLFQSSP